MNIKVLGHNYAFNSMVFSSLCADILSFLDFLFLVKFLFLCFIYVLLCFVSLQMLVLVDNLFIVFNDLFTNKNVLFSASL